MATRSTYLQRARDELWSREVFTFIPDRDLPPPEGTAEAGDGPAVVFTGFPSDYSLAFLLALLELDVRVVGIVTSPGAHPAILGDNALSRIADHLGIALLRAWRINDEHSRMHLAALQPEAVVMASFDQIVGHRTLEIPREGWLNIHPSLLPQYRGPEPVYWAIAEGAQETGITLHRAAPKVDSGPVYAQARVPVDPDETSGSLTRKLVAAGVEVLPAALHKLLAGDPGSQLDMSAASYRTSVGHRLLTSARSATEAERMVRAGVPNMLAWAQLDGHVAYVWKARLVSNGNPARLPVLKFPDGSLQILEASDSCGCHHDVLDCPHRGGDVASL
ncbi:MAG: hypothetical protein JOZ46_01085 [Candidatus Dormibacteraeota bacterium]|nr:hypothetical protein [Candidatus Dormibacteraeota bacterium]MBV9524387.1 hypothetical protein [Candidatus Dormibacteraeota bacterium]